MHSLVVRLLWEQNVGGSNPLAPTSDIPMNMTNAIPYSEGQVFPHFGKAAQFKIYVIAGELQSSASATCNHHGHAGGCGHHCAGCCH